MNSYYDLGAQSKMSDAKENMKKTQLNYAAGCPMHAENHTDYIDPNNMVCSPPTILPTYLYLGFLWTQ